VSGRRAAAACAITREEEGGWTAIRLGDGVWTATVLPRRGAEIASLRHLPSGAELLFRAPWGLAPPGSPPRAGSDGDPFLGGYAGGWQELFPNTGDPCSVDGADHPFHGDVATVAWDVVSERCDGESLELVVAVTSSTIPDLRLTRAMRMEAGAGRLVLSERVVNGGSVPRRFAWGHHCVLGPPLVGAGARLDVAATRLATPAGLGEETARLTPGQRGDWPFARLRAGGEVDLRDVPGPEVGSHDDVYLDGLEAGIATVGNDPLGLRFRLRWDPAVFASVTCWQPYGGAVAPPLSGTYALGVEPWTSGGSLADAVGTGRAIVVEAGGAVETALVAEVESYDAADERPPSRPRGAPPS
jgi:hypothetical protein